MVDGRKELISRVDSGLRNLSHRGGGSFTLWSDKSAGKFSALVGLRNFY
jgi:hypothetical protein